MKWHMMLLVLQLLLISDLAHCYKGKKSQKDDFDNANIKDLMGKKAN